MLPTLLVVILMVSGGQSSGLDCHQACFEITCYRWKETDAGAVYSKVLRKDATNAGGCFDLWRKPVAEGDATTKIGQTPGGRQIVSAASKEECAVVPRPTSKGSRATECVPNGTAWAAVTCNTECGVPKSEQ